MTREQARQILIDLGTEAPTSLQVSGLLNAIKDERSAAIEEAVKKAKEEFKDYISPEEYKKLLDENSILKDAGAKANRIAKYKEKKVAGKWVDYVDSQLKESKDLDKDLERFLKDNPELLVQENKEKDSKQEPKPFKFGNVKTDKFGEGTPTNMYEAVTEHYTKK